VVGRLQFVQELEVAPPKVADGTAEVAIATLKSGILIRFAGEDLEHARSLACRLDDCPPILVERRTATVIDGAHRVLAAKLLGRETIYARYFTGTHEEAFVEAVKANVSHGKPLTLAEREAAAKKLLEIHCDWSNRLVAGVCGLSDKTIGRLRISTAEIPQLSARVGRDGRHRPVDTRLLRNEIATVLRAEPDARPDDVARSLSTSASTVRDVRKRLRRGDDPVQSAPTATRRHAPLPTRDSDDTRVDWSNDKAILSLPDGSWFAEWLTQTKVESRHWEAHLHEIPVGRVPQLIAEAKTRAAEWTDFAAALEKRFKDLNRRRA
jgi:ParB-like chromosome segregation protein Spo0J